MLRYVGMSVNSLIRDRGDRSAGDERDGPLLVMSSQEVSVM